jgi:hypothetical protein
MELPIKLIFCREISWAGGEPASQLGKHWIDLIYLAKRATEKRKGKGKRH